MGVKHLTSLIATRWAPSLPADESLDSGATLLVDGLGLLHYLASRLGDELERHLGGDYGRFDAALRAWIGALRDAGHADVRVFMDGVGRVFNLKDATKETRRSHKVRWRYGGGGG